jgi:hypothetical protein
MVLRVDYPVTAIRRVLEYLLNEVYYELSPIDDEMALKALIQDH